MCSPVSLLVMNWMIAHIRQPQAQLATQFQASPPPRPLVEKPSHMGPVKRSRAVVKEGCGLACDSQLVLTCRPPGVPRVGTGKTVEQQIAATPIGGAKQFGPQIA